MPTDGQERAHSVDFLLLCAATRHSLRCAANSQAANVLRCLRSARLVRVLHERLPFQHLSNLTFIYCLACVVEFELVAATTHAEDLESVNFGDETRRRHHRVVEMLANGHESDVRFSSKKRFDLL